jgi:hypothetical protein
LQRFQQKHSKVFAVSSQKQNLQSFIQLTPRPRDRAEDMHAIDQISYDLGLGHLIVVLSARWTTQPWPPGGAHSQAQP